RPGSPILPYTTLFRSFLCPLKRFARCRSSYRKDDGTYFVAQTALLPAHVVICAPLVVGVNVNVHSPPLAPVFCDAYPIDVPLNPELVSVPYCYGHVAH